MDTSVNMVDACRNLMRFYAHESCGQCTPCREGCGWLVDVLNGICEGRAQPEDVHMLVDISNNMMGNTICAFADGTAMPMLGFIRKFHHEFVEVAKQGGLPGQARLDDSTRRLIGRAA
jgi:NADH-quinone oxidoreductase subunit F